MATYVIGECMQGPAAIPAVAASRAGTGMDLSNQDFRGQYRLSGGRLLGYAEYGDPAGAPVFYFHGWPSSRLEGRAAHAPALNLGLRLVAPERPGYGLSDF